MPENRANFSFLWRMALRDSRRSRSRLLLFVSSIVVGIAALVAINSFSDNLKADIEQQAKELLGADLELSSDNPDFTYGLLDTLQYEVSYENSFASMVFFPKNQQSRLVDVRTLSGDFPYYGKIETIPATAADSFRDGSRKALVDQSVMIQYDIEVGDSIRVGLVTLKVEGALVSSPSQSLGATLVAPLVYIPMAFQEDTELVKRGSRVNYRRFYKFTNPPSSFDIDAQIRLDSDSLRLKDIGSETVEERKAETGETFNNLSNFLNLVAFVALLLGCVGVASSVHIYIKEKIKSVAILRCLGASRKQTFFIFLLQIGGIGLIGAVLGAFFGTLVQTILPTVFADFLPVEVNFTISWTSITTGIITGLMITLLFAMIPLLGIRNTSPLITLRGMGNDSKMSKDKLIWLIYGLILLFIIGFAFVQTGNLQDSLVFTTFIGLSFSFLTGIAYTFMWAVKKYFPSRASFLWRQSLANLYRPNNQTLVLIASIGLGTALIATLYFIQTLLLTEVELTTDKDRPNLMVFDMQGYQVEPIRALAINHGLPILQEVPVVTMRIQSINGVTYDNILADSTIDRRSSPFRREWRVTYRDSLITSETLVRGQLSYDETPDWLGEGNTLPLVSLEDDYAQRNRIHLGDTIVWNVQGVPIATRLGNTRTIDWQRVQTNFLALFPSNVLEQAPQFHVLITRVESAEQGALFQREIVKSNPNVSVIDVGLILSTIDDILGKISFVIRFMALFSILTGLLVLISSVILSRFQRIRESILLRTMGGSQRQILIINSLEYFFLGSLASLSGIFLALLGSWGLAFYSFDTTFVPNLLPILLIYASITALTLLIGWANSRGIVSRPPLEVLRNELE